MGQDGSWVIFMDLNSNVVYESQREGDNVVTATGTITVSGSTLTMYTSCNRNAPDLLCGMASFAMQTQVGGFVLSVPTTNGTVKALDFKSGQSVSDYNDDVDKMHSTITSDKQEAAQAQDQARQKIENTKQSSCAAIGGTVRDNGLFPGCKIPPRGVCATDPASGSCRASNPSACVGIGVPFDPNGQLDQASLERQRATYPGCFG